MERLIKRRSIDMKKCDCGFKTINSKLQLCPVCNKKLEIFGDKRKFFVNLLTEESFETRYKNDNKYIK
jgi:dTDP-4-dehydrorhamnose 3,5-epimerase-like enzyme